MLTQVEVDRLLAVKKIMEGSEPIAFPSPGGALQLKADSEDGRDSFLIDVNRRGKIKLTRCTYQERYAVVEILLRLDIDGPSHVNPDGMLVPCPHLHVYREGYADKWAYPLPTAFTTPADLLLTFAQFLAHCNISTSRTIDPSLF